MSDVITLVTAPAGSGKTYSRVRWLVDSFLPEGDGCYFSNLPINAEAVADLVAERTGRPFADFDKRLVAIPAEVCEAWRMGESGPWAFFHELDLEGGYVAFDEAHEFCSAKHTRTIKREWQKWLGQIRHRGCRVELITQHEDKLAKELRNEAGLRLELVNAATQRDPFMRVPLSDWYELRAAWLTGEYVATVGEIELRQVAGKWRESDRRRYSLEPRYFALYDSYSTPEMGGTKASAPLREFERRGRLGLAWWFLRRNWWRVGRAVAITAAVVSLPWSGPVIISRFVREVQTLQARRTAAAPNRSEAEGGAPAVPPRFKKGPAGGPVAEEAAAIAKLESDLAASRKELSELQERFARGFILVGIAGDEALFANGGRARVGEKIDVGPYEGRSVRRIDWKRRAVVLDNGNVLRVGADGVVPGLGPQPTIAERGVSGRVPGDGKDRYKPALRSVLVRPAGDDVNGGDASGRVLSAPGGSGPVLNRGGGEVRFSTGDGGSPR